MIGRCLALAAIALFLLLGGTAGHAAPDPDAMQHAQSDSCNGCEPPENSGECCSLFCVAPAAMPHEDLAAFAPPRTRFASVALVGAPVATPQPEPSPPRIS